MGNAVHNKCLTTPMGQCEKICDGSGTSSSVNGPGDVFVVGDSLVHSKDVFPRFEVTHIKVDVDPANADCVVDPDRAIDHRAIDQVCKEASKEASKEVDGQTRRRTFDNGIIYEGQWREQTRHGHGLQVWPDGAMYEGQWADDKAHGEGRFNHVDGDMYVGQWCTDKAQGRGIYFHADGSKYEGQWLEDNRHGSGIETWPDGAKYDGQYADGLKNGTGKFLLPNGSKYVGEFVNNDIHGAGLYEWFDGRKYQGQYAHNQMHGAGVFTGADGHSYDGQYIADQKDGFGAFSWPDGCKYAGQWKQGRQHGSGALSTMEGETKHGRWKDGRLLDPGLYKPGEDPSKLTPVRTRSVVTGIVPPEEQRNLGPGGMPPGPGEVRPGALQQVNIQPGPRRPASPPARGTEDPYLLSEPGASDASTPEDFRLPTFQAPRQEDKSTRGCCSFSWALPSEEGRPPVPVGYDADGFPLAGHRGPDDAAAPSKFA